jgi:hypothetical protein
VLLVLLTGCLSPTNSTPASPTTVASVDAQYFAFYSTTKAYVSAFDYTGSAGGVYSFTPVASSTSTSAAGLLFLTDSTSGHVYSLDPSATRPSSSLLLTTASAAGEIKFYKGIGYVAVGDYSGAGVYTFNPGATNPTAAKIGAYTPVSGTIGKNFQEVVVGTDSMVYAADNTDAKVLRINPATDTVTATFTASAAGTTGLVSGSYGGTAGIFVANTGGYDSNYNPLPGSIDFIPYGTASKTLTAIVSSTVASASIYPGRLMVLASGDLIASGGAGHTYYVSLSGTASATEILAASSAFGSFSIAYDSANNLVYVPYNVYSSTNATNLLYVFQGTTAATQQGYSPVTVMTKTDNLANVAFYQN